MSEIQKFKKEVEENVKKLTKSEELKELSNNWVNEVSPFKYSYNFSWLGRPIIQFPQDMIALQEIVWNTKPDLIIETGVAHGGSLIFYASILEMLGGTGEVVGIDIDIRKHNRAEIEKHSLYKRIQLLEGSSTSPTILESIRDLVKDKERVMVILDSCHSHSHVLDELHQYSDFVTKGCYLVVLDTIVEDMPEGSFPDRPWGKGNNPKTAVWEFLKNNNRFEIDQDVQGKLLISVAPDGYLRCVKD